MTHYSGGTFIVARDVYDASDTPVMEPLKLSPAKLVLKVLSYLVSVSMRQHPKVGL